ncbi:MAG: sortase [Actinomycetota bacterium]|nr:sortase [Actinomycetota bacterium]
MKRFQAAADVMAMQVFRTTSNSRSRITERWTARRIKAERTVPTAARIPLVILLLTAMVGGIGPAAKAAPVLTIEPITWNVVGLDSNNVNSGPNRFMVGARACNTGTDPATNIVATFVWDSTNPLINLVGASTLSTESLAPGACFDFNFNIAVTRSTAAYRTSRDYHISVSADGLGAISTPIGREIYVEQLVSQNRNSVQAITGPGGLGDPPATTVFVGETYTYKLYSSTAPGGYEQLESFINFSNVIFQVLSVSTTYTTPPGATNDKIYADACGWDNDPASPTYRSCVGPVNYPGGKAGGNIVTTYTVKILSPGTTVISALIYDFSGSSYHYNSDFESGVNAVTVRAVAPAGLSLTKSHTGDFTVGQQGTYQLSVTNQGGVPASGPITITDTLPAGLSFVSGTGSGWTCSAVGQDVSCNHAGDLAAGATSSLDLTVAVGPGAAPQVTNSATVSFNGTEPTPADNTATDTTNVIPSADLSISVSHTGEMVVGLPFTFDIQVSNAGPSTSSGPITVTDTLPAGLTYVSFSGTGWSCSSVGQDVTCTHAGDLAAAASSSLALIVDVDEAALPSVTNSATVVPTTLDPDSSNNSDSDLVAVAGVADLSITKSHSGNFVAGEEGTYNVTVSNEGTGAAAGPVVVTDTLPGGLSFVSGSGTGWTCAALGQDVTCTHAADVAVGGSSSFSLTVDVASDAPASVTNAATVSSESSDADPSNDTDQDATIIDRLADLSIAKSHSGPFVVATEGTYEIAVSNAGPSDADGPITVSDTLPAGLTYDSVSGAGWSCSAVGQDITCTHAGDLAAGNSSSFSITVDVGMDAVPSVTNSASVASSTSDPDESNNSDADLTQVDQSADLSITKTVSDDPFFIGAIRTFTLTVSNAGPSPATDVRVVDLLPAELSFVSATPSQGSCAEVAGVVVCSLGTLAPGDTETVAVVVSPTAAGDVENTAEVLSEADDPDPLNNEDTLAVTVEDPPPQPQADVSIIKSHTGSFQAGSPATYNLIVSNAGPSDAQGPIIVSDTLPAGLSYSSFSGAGWSCSAVAQDVTCTHAGDLAAGANTTVSLVVDVGSDALPSVTNVASVDSETVDPDDTNNTDQDASGVDPVADLSLTKVASADPVQLGSPFTYTITVSNDGPSAAAGVQMADLLPSALTFVSADPSQGSCIEIAGVVACSLGTIAAGNSATIALRVLPTAAGNVDNTAEVLSSVADPDPSNNEDTEGVTVEAPPPAPQADLILAKSHSGDLTPGATATYVIEVSNAGPDAAEGPIVVRDELPSGLTFVSASGTGWECSATGAVVLCNRAADLGVGDATTINLVVRLDARLASEIANAASVSSETLDPNVQNNQDDDVAALAAGPAPPRDDPADDSSPTAGRPRRLAYTGFGFDRLGSFAVTLFAIGALLLVLAAALRRSGAARGSRTADQQSLGEAWTAAPAPRTLGMTPRRASRLGVAVVVSGLLLAGHIGWMVWGSGLGTARAQAQLRTDFSVSNEVNRNGMKGSVAAGSAIGVIRVPRLDVDMVVVEGTGPEQLEKGPGHYRDTAMPWDPSGRVGIAGHRTTHLKPFLSLDKLRLGDLIVLETKRGTFRYEVRSSREVEPTDVSVLRQTSRPSLALTTCSPLFSAEKRLVVIADLVWAEPGR